MQLKVLREPFPFFPCVHYSFFIPPTFFLPSLYTIAYQQVTRHCNVFTRRSAYLRCSISFSRPCWYSISQTATLPLLPPSFSYHNFKALFCDSLRENDIHYIEILINIDRQEFCFPFFIFNPSHYHPNPQLPPYFLFCSLISMQRPLKSEGNGNSMIPLPEVQWMYYREMRMRWYAFKTFYSNNSLFSVLFKCSCAILLCKQMHTVVWWAMDTPIWNYLGPCRLI